MNPVYLRATWARVVIMACGLMAATNVAASDFDTMSTEDVDRAIVIFDALLQADPNSANGHLQRGLAWLAKKDLDKALTDLNSAIGIDPNLCIAFEGRGRARQSKGDYALAIADFNEAIRLVPDHAATYVRRGTVLAARRKWDEAIADFAEAIRLDSTNAEAYRQRSQAYSAQEDGEHAIADMDEAIRLEPDNALSYTMRGWMWYMMGNSNQAVSDYNEAIRLDPRDTRAYLRRTVVWIKKQNFSQALLDVQAADEIDPTLIPNKRVEELAKQAWQAANEKLIDRTDQNHDDAKFANAYRDRGVALHAMNDFDGALEDLTEAIRIYPSSGTYVLRGQVWLRKHEWDNAINDFDTAIQLNPSDAAAWKVRGTAHAKKHEWVQACDDFSQAIEADPHRVRTFAERGAAWQAQQEWDRAIADYDRVTSGGPLYVHAPKRRWQSERSAQLESNSSDNSTSAATFGSDSDFATAIRKHTDSTGESGTNLFEKPTEDPTGIFGDSDVTNRLNSHHQSRSRPAQPSNSQRSEVDAVVSNPVCLDPLYLMVFRNRAECWERKREWSKALADYQELIRLTPSDSLVYRRIAWVKATCPDADFRSGAEAIRYVTEAIERAHFEDPENLIVLAAAQAESGDFDQAIETQELARELATQIWEKEFVDRRKHFEALEFQQSIENGEHGPTTDGPRLVAAAMETCERSEWRDAALIEALADAHATAGEFEQAIACQMKAHALKVAAGDKPFLERLELYRAGKPCRDEPWK